MVSDLTPVAHNAGTSRLVGMVFNHSKRLFRTWRAERPRRRERVEVVAINGFAGSWTATTDEMPGARMVMTRSTWSASLETPSTGAAAASRATGRLPRPCRRPDTCLRGETPYPQPGSAFPTDTQRKEPDPLFHRKLRAPENQPPQARKTRARHLHGRQGVCRRGP